jgi:pimeloyl-ACP methyl ester carboxylesterase
MPSRDLAARAFNIARWSKMAAGGHFAAMEEPEAFASDVIAFFTDQSG